MATQEPTDYQNRISTVKGRLLGKTSKEVVNYRPAADEAESMESCSECKFFEKQGHFHSDCEKVAGIVEARDICDKFAQRTSSSQQSQPGLNVQLHLNIGEG